MDYSQQELRLVGAVSNEKKMIDAYLNKVDIHTITASLIFDKPVTDITKEERFFGKTLNFAVLYGTTEFGLKYNLQIPLDKAIDMIKSFYTGYPELSKFKKLCEEKILELGYSITPLGRRRYWSPKPIFADIFEVSKYREKMKREGFNFIIQGGGADITKIAMCNLFYKNPFGDKFRILLQVHDEIVAEVHDTIIDDAVKFMQEQMINAEQSFLGKIPAEVSWKISKKWSK
jgi:DNA polymerase I